MARSPAIELRAVAALVVVQVLFGGHYVAAKMVVAEVPPAAWALMRAGSAAGLLLALSAGRGLPWPRSGRAYRDLAVLAVFGVAVNQYLFVEGIHRTTPGHSAIINTAIPVLVLAMAVLAGRERPSRARLLGIVVTLTGVLALLGAEQLDLESPLVRGDLLTLANATSFSLFLVMGKPVVERQGAIVATTILFLFGTLWLLPVGLPALVGMDFARVPAKIWLLGLVIVLGPTVGTYGLNLYALRRVDSSVVALFVYLQPVVGTGLSLALGYERLTLGMGGAAALVFGGIYLALRRGTSGGSDTGQG